MVRKHVLGLGDVLKEYPLAPVYAGSFPDVGVHILLFVCVLSRVSSLF